MPFNSVLVTGANRGLGLEFVRQFATQRDGPRHVFACYREWSKAKELAEIAEGAKNGVRVHPVSMGRGACYIIACIADVTSDEQIAEVVKYVESIVRDDGLNLLINNAGILQSNGTKLPNVDRQLLISHFDINAASPLMITQAFLPLLQKAAKRHMNEPMSLFHAGVVNISSGIGSLANNTTGANLVGYGYRLSKAALNMATKCLAVDLKEDKILFISMCPGWVQTDMGGQRATSTPEQSISAMLKTFPQFTDEHSGGYFQRDGNVLPF